MGLPQRIFGLFFVKEDPSPEPESEGYRIPAVPKRFDRLIRRCIQKNPVDCFDDFEELKPELLPKDRNNDRDRLKDPGLAEEMVTACDCLAMLDPENAQALINKGDLLAELGRFNEAASAYNRASELSPDDVTVSYNKGLSLAKLGRWKEALDAFEEVLSRNRISPVRGTIKEWCLSNWGCS